VIAVVAASLAACAPTARPLAGVPTRAILPPTHMAALYADEAVTVCVTSKSMA
jgi:hypothetical protein